MSESNNDDDKKRKKDNKSQYWSKKVKHEHTIKYGQQGCLYTYLKGREHQATKDMISLLNQYSVELDDKTETDAKSTNFMNDFEKELAMAREEGKKNKKGTKSNLYEKLELNCEGISFVGFKEEASKYNVDEITNNLFNDIETSKSTKTRYLTRIIPVQTTCNFLTYKETVQKLIDEKLNSLSEPKKYKIEFRSRYNTSIEKDKEIQAIAAFVNEKHPVDLENPEYTIIIEIIKQFCSISIVSNFIKYKKYNLSNIAGIPQYTGPKKQKPTDKKENDSKDNEKDEKEKESLGKKEESNEVKEEGTKEE